MHNQRSADMGGIRNWAVQFTGAISLQKIAKFDLIILDPDNGPPPGKIGKGTITVAYISLGEIEDYRSHWPRGKAVPWIVRENEEWPGNFLVDVRSREWGDLLRKKIIPNIISSGFKGLFLDTLDTAIELEDENPRRFRGSKKAMVSLVKRIRRLYPYILLFSNNGFELLEEIAPYLDGVIAEDVNSRYDFTNKYYKRTSLKQHKEMVKILNHIKVKYNIPIFTIDYASARDKELIETAKSTALKNDFLAYVSTVELNRIFYYCYEKRSQK